MSDTCNVALIGQKFMGLSDGVFPPFNGNVHRSVSRL